MASRSVDPNQSFPELEHEVLARWKERDVFAESLRAREGRPEFVFYEGPPTANGKPGAHHVLARVFKDIFPRYKTMRGFHVARKGGWDTHGLPVEIQVEKQLGLTSKTEIEAYGIEEFNAACRASVFTYLEDWNALTERIGFWLDLDDAYRTLDPGYVESVWWALKQIWNKGLIYEGHKVVPYCPRCGTALASHEVAQGYKDVVDTSVYVRIPVKADHGPVRAGDELLIWTTLPWTVLPNALVAVNPAIAYVRASAPGEPAPVVVAEALVERVLGSEGVEILERFDGAALEGVAYTPVFDYITTADYGARGHTVVGAEFVSAEDGTGLVGTAIAFGEDDYKLGVGAGLAVINPVRPDGTFDERMGPFAEMDVRAADALVVEDLRERGRLLRATPYEHSFPHCWRCQTPLLYYAKPSWYIETSKVREHLEAANESIDVAPAAHQARPDGRLAGQQRRLGAQPRALLGHPAAGVALRGGPHALRRLAGRARGALRRAPGRSAPPLRRRRLVPLPAVRAADAARARGHRRLVRLRRDALRPAPRAVRARGPLRAALPRGLRLRGARPDARLVLLADRRRDAAVRPRADGARRLPRADPRRGGPEDVQVAREHRRAEHGDRPLRRGRVALVLLHLQAAVGRLPLLDGGRRRRRAAVPQAAVEHLRVPDDLHRRGGRRARADRARPLDPLAAERHRRPR